MEEIASQEKKTPIKLSDLLNPPKPTISAKISSYFRRGIAIFFWFYVLTKLFIFDFDIYLLSKLGDQYENLLRYKFFILIALIAVIIAITRNKVIFGWTLYILLFPLILIFWKFPLFILRRRSWFLTFAVLNTIISFFKSYKYKLVSVCLFVCSVFLIGISSNQYVLIGSSLTIFVILISAYVRIILFAFKPSRVFELYLRYIKTPKEGFFKDIFVNKEIRDLPIETLNEKQIQTWKTNLEMSILYNRFILYLSKKFRDYQESKIGIISHLVNLLFLEVVTIFSFVTINLALYKINPSFFNVSQTPQYFDFLYYTFKFGSIEEVKAVSMLPKIFVMAQVTFQGFFVLVVASLIFSMRTDRYKKELENTIDGLKQEGDVMKGFIETEFKMNFEKAFEEIQKTKSFLVSAILWLSKDL